MRKRPRQWRSGALVLVLFSLFCAQPSCARATDPSQVKTIFVFGDSLSEGVAITPRQAWPMLLVEKLRPIGPNFRVINASASGGTTEGGLRRLPPHLEHPIDIFILELGINDAFNGIPLEQTSANLQSIIDQVKARNPNASIVIVGIQFPIAAPDSEYATAFAKMFGELAAKNQAALVPNLLEDVVGDPKLNLPDRIHPNAAGHKILVEKCMARTRTDLAGGCVQISDNDYSRAIDPASFVMSSE
jgi:acyl-CoA thioesterase-1